MNFGCILLDSNRIEIGDDTLIGPNVQFYPPGITSHCMARLTQNSTASSMTIVGERSIHCYTCIGHPICGVSRDGTRGPEFAHPIKVGKNCWIGGNVIIMGLPLHPVLQTISRCSDRKVLQVPVRDALLSICRGVHCIYSEKGYNGIRGASLAMYCCNRWSNNWR